MFAYCLNNPVRYVDHDGFDVEEACYEDQVTDDMFPDMDGAPIQSSVGYTYSPPQGGGGVSTSVTVGNTTVTFGHGGGHMGGENIAGIENFIAHHVVTQPPSTTAVRHVTVSYCGQTLEYGYFTRTTTLINVGTYFFHICK